jgi:hypothetical protein
VSSLAVISIAFGFLLVVVNTVVTVAIARSDMYEPMQKRLQYLFVWLLPCVGAIISWYVLSEEARVNRKNGDSGNESLWWNYPDKNEVSHNDHGDGGE